MSPMPLRQSSRNNKGKPPASLDAFIVNTSSPNDSEEEELNAQDDADSRPVNTDAVVSSDQPAQPVSGNSKDDQILELSKKVEEMFQMVEMYRIEAQNERKVREQAERVLQMVDQGISRDLERMEAAKSNREGVSSQCSPAGEVQVSNTAQFIPPSVLASQCPPPVVRPNNGALLPCISGQPTLPVQSNNGESHPPNAPTSQCPPAVVQPNNGALISPSVLGQHTLPVVQPHNSEPCPPSVLCQPTIPVGYAHSHNGGASNQLSVLSQNTYLPAQQPSVNIMQGHTPQPSSSGGSSGHQLFVPMPSYEQPGQSIAKFTRQKLMDLPPFSGKPEEWPAFHTFFCQSTHSFGYTSLDNLYRLQRCLTGAARQSVETLLIHHQNVDRVISSLAFKFGRPELLARNQLEKVRSIKPIVNQNIEQIVPFASTVENLVAFLKNGQCEYELINPQLLSELVAKLPMFKRLEWTQHSIHMVPRATIVEFSNWLNLTAQYVTLAYVDMEPATHSQPRHQNTPQQRNQKGRSSFFHVTEQSSSFLNCLFCRRSHKQIDCMLFRDWTPNQRWNEVKRLRLCFSCLKSGHGTAMCRFKRRCGINDCQQFHHTLLHEINRQTNSIVSQPAPLSSAIQPTHLPSQVLGASSSSAPSTLSQQTTASNNGQPYVNPFAPKPVATKSNLPPPIENSLVLTHCREDDRKQKPLLFRILPVVLYGRSKSISTFAMIDEGAAVTLLDSDLANELGLDGQPGSINLQWFGNVKRTVESRTIALEISGTQNHHKRLKLCNVKTVPSLSLPTQTVRLGDIHSNQRLIKNLPIQEYEQATPRILIGLDYSHLAAPMKTIRGSIDGPTVVNTELGWIVYGRQSHLGDNDQAHFLHVQPVPESTNDDDLHQLVQEYFTTENFGVKPPEQQLESANDARARQILDRATRRLGDRYQTGLLWCRDDVTLPDSYAMALRRLITVERKMKRDPNYAALYCQNINDYVAKGYARRLTDAEAEKTGPRTWYLPHFGVINVHKPGKLRMVFDAAACVNGVSLNSQLLSGPDLNPSLPGILFKFRVGEVAVCGDISEMFHQVVMQPEDRDAQRFLWRDGNDSRRPDIYEMVAMTFGATCSPASAQFAKNRNAEEHVFDFPAALKPIKELHYVDDFVASFATSKEAAEVTAAVTEVHRRGGFVLRNFVSNDINVLHAIGATTNNPIVKLQPKSPTTTDRILGMCWNTNEDAFSFQPSFTKIHEDVRCGRRPPTKREVLSIAMSVFDPFGLLADYMLHAKLIVQDLWRVGSGWDEPISAALTERWTNWFAQMDQLHNCRVPRCYSPQLRTSPCVQLHVFADASESAFAAVAYWRVQHNNQFTVSFIAGKTKCAPLKLLSIPRLELQAAVLASRLTATIRAHHDVTIEKTVLWSDSKTVLQWIRSDHRRYKPFVAHRIAEVLDVTSVSDWRWIPTSQNVADDATRAKAKPKFDPNGRWLVGPDFLLLEELDWPTESPINNDEHAVEEEMRPKFVGVVITKDTNFISFNRFSQYSRLRRTLAWVLRFISNVSTKRRQTQRTQGELTVQELDESELLLCRMAQANTYPKELAALTENRPIESSSSVKSLMPYLAEKNLIRIYGRTDAAHNDHLPASAKRPILLPKSNALTKLIIDYFHRRMHHQNDDAVTCAIRVKFWVPHLRVAVRRARLDCRQCKLRTARPSPPVMGQLPPDRLTPIRPFTFTGLDFFGPLFVTVGRRQEKRWAALFTCLTMRAVHIELAADLSADACLLCVRNFANIRGVPQRIRSDNGTNFIAASKVVRDCPDFFDDVKMRRELSNLGIEWVFNSPGHPEAGGCWERLVQCIKRVLVTTLRERAPRVETLRSYLIEAANIINCRPLTHVPVSPDDESPLTPNHWLIGGTSSTTVPVVPDEKIWCLRKQWRIAQQLSNCFWAQWVRSYLPELTRRTKWHNEQPPIQIGDLVLVCDANQSRNEWRRGRIVTVFPGPDGRVRNVEVKTTDGLLRRPVSKCAVLDVLDEPQMLSVHGGGDVV